MSRVKRFIAFVVVAVVLGGCQTNPISGRSQFMLVSEDYTISESKTAYTAMLKPLADEGKIDNDPAVVERVDTITSRLVAQAILYRPETEAWAWSVRVIDDPDTVNAWCMAGGRMAIYTGLIDQLDATDDEIAQVMGHEISHALLAHTRERMSRAIALQLGLTAAAISQSDSQSGQLAVQGAAMAAVIALELPNSRSSEAEADVVGIEIAAKAGYDPRAAETLWAKMAEVGGGGESRFDFFSTHPAPLKRMETLRDLAPQMMPYYEDQSPRPTYPLN